MLLKGYWLVLMDNKKSQKITDQQFRLDEFGKNVLLIDSRHVKLTYG
jgi:hypothetical protein